MEKTETEHSWKEYRDSEIALVTPFLLGLGFELEENQPHVQGERFLMHAVTTTSGRKLILLGREKKTGRRVVIKVTSDSNGIKEIQHERQCRQVLKDIRFAHSIFSTPHELLYTKNGSQVISIQEFIEQESSFLDRPITEQFSFALSAFKAQEGAHATTAGHIALIQKNFQTTDSRRYLQEFSQFKNNCTGENCADERLASLFAEAEEKLSKNAETIEQYCGFLTHVDFVPHNFRIRENTIFLLDHSSLRFGNKYEGWARFLNFMTLYGPELEEAFVGYVKNNRTPEELLSLQLMRIFRLGEIIWYYTNTLSKVSGDLLNLNKARVEFWTSVLESTLRQEALPTAIREEYKQKRESLRSEDEKRRQEGLH